MDRGDRAEEMEGLLHPFEVFPEELWPEILEKLQDSAEILKVMDAIPEIKYVMESRKRWWLFDQVLPHISPWLEQGDILSCRQVCQLWSHGVDNFLENHPRYRAYNPEEPVTGQVWIHDRKPSNLTAWRNFRFRRWMDFDRRKKIVRFLQKTREHPKERSPIVGRAVHVSSKKDMEILKEASQVFRELGRHIWFLSMQDFLHDDPVPFSNSIREWLALLPNLKSFRLNKSLRNVRARGALDGFLNVTYVDDDEEFFAKSALAQLEPVEAKKICQDSTSEKEAAAAPDPWMEPLPPLPHLETLGFLWDTLPPSMVHALMSSYCQQIRRLWIPLRYWKPEYCSTMFPNLTELTFEYVFSMPRLLHILLNLQAPLLYDLELWLTDTPEQLDVETDILPWLKRFPAIRNLSLLADEPLPGTDVVLDPDLDSVPSLKYLAVPESFVHSNSDLLLCFPNLEYLDLGDSPNTQEDPFEPSLEIWDNFWDGTVYESNVWELLPKLKVIAMMDPNSVLDEGIKVRFTREMYEYERKLGGGGVNPDSN